MKGFTITYKVLVLILPFVVFGYAGIWGLVVVLVFIPHILSSLLNLTLFMFFSRWANETTYLTLSILEFLFAGITFLLIFSLWNRPSVLNYLYGVPLIVSGLFYWAEAEDHKSRVPHYE